MNDYYRGSRWDSFYKINQWLQSDCFGGATNKHNTARQLAAKARILKRKKNR